MADPPCAINTKKCFYILNVLILTKPDSNRLYLQMRKILMQKGKIIFQDTSTLEREPLAAFQSQFYLSFFSPSLF